MAIDMQALKSICFGNGRDKRNERQLAAWSLAWVGSWLAFMLARQSGWLGDGALATVLAVACVLLGAGPFLAYWQFLREADELRRKIELDALALAFGVGVLGAVSYDFLATAGLVSPPDLAHVVVTMVLVYVGGVIAGHRRYR